MITDNVEYLRRGRGWTQQQLAERMGYTRAGLHQKLSGRSRWSTDDLDELAALFGVPPFALVWPGLRELGGPVGLLPTRAYVTDGDDQTRGEAIPA